MQKSLAWYIKYTYLCVQNIQVILELGLMMRKKKYEKPASIIVSLMETTAVLSQSEGTITDDPATEPAMVKEVYDFEEEEETENINVNLWNNKW